MSGVLMDGARLSNFAGRSAMYSRIADWGAILLGAVFITAATAKIITQESFAYYVTTIRFLPVAWQDRLIFLVPAAEITLGTALLLPIGRRAVLIAALCVLIILTGFLAALVLQPTAPWCDCFGTIRLARDANIHNRLALIRNLLLLIIVCVSLWARHKAANERSEPPLSNGEQPA